MLKADGVIEVGPLANKHSGLLEVWVLALRSSESLVKKLVVMTVLAKLVELDERVLGSNGKVRTPCHP
eukprot:3901577-Amphidinium_carterae.1